MVWFFILILSLTWQTFWKYCLILSGNFAFYYIQLYILTINGDYTTDRIREVITFTVFQFWLCFLCPPPPFFPSLGCSNKISGKSCSFANDCPWTLVSEPKNRVYSSSADCLKTSWCWLCCVWMEWNYRILHSR